ncbi:MAG: phytoene/squalene synthase family protein [Pseudolabrys sp.]
MEDHFKHCAALVRERDRDRYIATLFAPTEERGGLFALYAFDTEIARVRELAREVMPGEVRLHWWRDVIVGERIGEAAANPIATALLETQTRYSLPRERMVDLIEAHRFDIYNEPIARFEDLQSYASKTAGTIFELAVRILMGGNVSAISGSIAEAGVAQTIANVLARLPRHSASHQMYLPIEILRHYHAEPDDVFAMRATPELRAALAELRLRGRRHLAHVGAADIPKAAQPAFLPLAPLWQWLLDMERTDYDPFQPPHVAQWRQQWRIWRAAKSFRRIGC